MAAALLLALAGCDTARPLDETAGGDCGRCHGFPPETTRTGTGHPGVAAPVQAAACSACHPQTVAANGDVIAGGAHQNGVVDASGGHEPGFDAPAVHGPQALAFLSGVSGALDCTTCHGTDFAGGTSGRSCNDCHAGAAGTSTKWTENCTFCHGTRTANYAAIANPVLAAPPEGVAGETAATDHHVGAHQRHLTGGNYSNPFTCATCHAVPTDLSHLDRATAVAPRGAGQRSLPASLGTYTPVAQTCAVYCHGDGATLAGANETPGWTSAPSGGLACNACHASRPATGGTVGHQSNNHNGAPCAFCHKGYVQDTSANLAIHVDGQKTIFFDNRGGTTTTLTNAGWDCAACHTAATTGNANAPGFLP